MEFAGVRVPSQRALNAKREEVNLWYDVYRQGALKQTGVRESGRKTRAKCIAKLNGVCARTTSIGCYCRSTVTTAWSRLWKKLLHLKEKCLYKTQTPQQWTQSAPFSATQFLPSISHLLCYNWQFKCIRSQISYFSIAWGNKRRKTQSIC